MGKIYALVKQGVPVGPQNWSRLGFDHSFSIRYFGPKTHSQHSGLVISCDFQDVQSNGGMVSSIDRQNIWLGLGWVETTSSFYPLDPLVCCVCPKVGYTPENKGSPQFIGGFRKCWWILGCIFGIPYPPILYIYILYIYTIHDILNSCGWRTGNPARFNRWSSLTETIFQHERRMQQLVVSCILDFPIHFCGINPINTLFVRSWCTMRTFISLFSTFVGQIRSARAATFSGATRF